MIRSQLHPLPEYFDRYINMTDDETVHEALLKSLLELENAPIEDWVSLGHSVYAPDKWTINDILQHLIDTERIFCYRAVAFARGDRDVKSYDESAYGKNANAQFRSIENIMEEAIAVRNSSIHLFKSFTEVMLGKTGNGFKGEYSVHAIGYILAGHQRWHFEIIKEKYMPLIK